MTQRSSSVSNDVRTATDVAPDRTPPPTLRPTSIVIRNIHLTPRSSQNAGTPANKVKSGSIHRCGPRGADWPGRAVRWTPCPRSPVDSLTIHGAPLSAAWDLTVGSGGPAGLGGIGPGTHR